MKALIHTQRAANGTWTAVAINREGVALHQTDGWTHDEAIKLLRSEVCDRAFYGMDNIDEKLWVRDHVKHGATVRGMPMQHTTPTDTTTTTEG